MKLALGGLLFCSVFVGGNAFAEESSYDWSGAYAGANLGSIWSGADLKASHPNFVSAKDRYDQSLESTEVNPGLQFGYLHQFDQNWVLGGEADFTYPDANSGFTRVNATGSALDNFNVRNDLQGSLRLRLGYAIDRFLPFVTAGVSWASLGLYYQNEGSNAYSKRTAQTGWVLGGGVEYGFLENLSGRLEYLYSDYGSALNMNTPTVGDITDPGASAHADVFSNVLRAGVNYRF